MILHKEKCLGLGLPEPQDHETQLAYVIKCIANGHNLDTRQCRYIGIHNLHSLVSLMAKRKVEFSLGHGRVLCPFTKEVPPYPVDIVYMTLEQQQKFSSKKTVVRSD